MLEYEQADSSGLDTIAANSIECFSIISIDRYFSPSRAAADEQVPKSCGCRRLLRELECEAHYGNWLDTEVFRFLHFTYVLEVLKKGK